MGILVDVPLMDYTYYVHLETVTCFLVLLSAPMQSSQRADHSSVFRLVTSGRHAMHAPLLVRSLVQNFIDQKRAPPAYGAGSDNQGLVFGKFKLIQVIQANMQCCRIYLAFEHSLG